ncbi:MAG TPA: PilC/PilY family type IV pilus protein [Myxococcaceae bacterium]|nr:PilC/PilY family type IV pilus protein [Myxococcaceae bacterium]
MRQVKLVSQFGVMWMLVFVMAAGPLPLGIPRAQAAGPSITDLPGLQNFYNPKVFIIFDTSKSMAYRPADPNDDPTAIADDWDPNIPTPDTACRNKFCIGKRALYRTLPKYSPRIEMGLSGYSQYYQLTSRPSTVGTQCRYDQLSLGYAPWGTYRFGPVLDDLDSTGPGGPTGMAATPFTYTPPGLPASHPTRKWVVRTGASGDVLSKNVGNGLGGPGSQITVTLSPGQTSPGGAQSLGGGTYTYDWHHAVGSAGVVSLVKGGSCATPVLGYTGGACAGDPCDLTLTGQHTTPFPPFTSGTDLGDPYTSGTTTYSRSGPTTATFTDLCGKTSPYVGGGASCNLVFGGCTITKINGPYNIFTGGISNYYDATYTPPGSWQLVGTTSSTVDVLMTTYGVACPALGTVVTSTSGPAGWQSLATGGPGAGTPTTWTGCSAAAGMSCSWTMTNDFVVSGEVTQHYCRFQRPIYQWQPTAQRCDYKTQLWTYNTAQGTDYCDYKFDRDYYTTPKYTYSYVPNDGDLLGTTAWSYTGNDDVGGYPSAVTYSGGSFSNGDCPNLVMNSAAHPQCNSGVLCKLTWASNTTVGATNYPLGRYTGVPYGPGGMPFTTTYVPPYPSAEPAASLTDPLFPPSPLGYSGDWVATTGARDSYWVTLMANIYNPADTNPPSPPLFIPAACGGICTFQYAYTEPAGLVVNGPRPAAPPVPDPNYQVNAGTSSLSPGAFSAVAATMPPNRNSGWAQLPDNVTPAISWQGVALNNALNGATPATDGPLLKMLSKYDRVNNPTGVQMPDFGDYTPLTGSLNDVAEYLRSYVDTDPYSGCGRKYYVLLLTDGEEQPVLAGNDPVAAVTALRNLVSNGGIKVDVKTFVIGFGFIAPSPQLNAMARAGGTAVSASDPSKLDLVGGVALDGTDEARLFASLDISFGKILSGYFTRSKPVVNVLGTEMYVGYMRILQGLEWQGKLDSIDIKSTSLPNLANTLTSDGNYNYLWRYGDAIDAQGPRSVYTSLNPSAGNRIFFDYSGCSGGTHTCVSSAGWNSNAAADQTSLETLIDGSSPSVAKETIAFLLNPGAPTSPELFDDGKTQKTSRASDIFHATPAIVEGASQSTTWPDLTESGAYAAFRTDPTISNRDKTVYIGANDGMLHAVKDNVTLDSGGFPVTQPGAGEERWGYVPQQLLPALKAMRQAHAYGVDGSVAVADVCGPGFSTSPCTVKDGWKTLLVGALGKGGGGLYALDITDPANPLPIWEVSSPLTMVPSRSYTPRLGETWGAPVIARTEISTGHPWSVFVGGGVVPAADPVQPWGSLFYVLDARTGQVLTDGTNTAAFSIWDDPADPAPNGVATRPTLFRPGDNALARKVFFADTEGKVWRMDLSSTDITTWKPGNTAADPFFDPASPDPVCALNVSGVPTPILNATTGVQVVSGVPLTLPITTVPRAKIYNRPMIAVDSTGSLNVYVGTGDSDNPGTLGTYDYFYALADIGGTCGAPLFVLRFDPGEKVLSDPAFLNNTIFVTTYVPVSTPGHICEVGRGFLYSFDARSGLPVLALMDPFNGNTPTSKLDLGDVRNPQLGQGGIPSAPIVRGNKLYVANETDPSHPRQIDLVGSPLTVKVRGWQRVK